jgi:hypothetical protein
MASSDNGVTWRDVSLGLPNRSIASIKVDPSNPQLAYLTVSGYGSGHVFKTADSGATWQDISANLPDIPVSTLLIDPLSSSGMYLGTDIGVFHSSGGAWQFLGKGMPPAVVTEIAAQPGGLIRAATYGRGAYELSPSVPPVPPAITAVTWNGAKLLSIDGTGFDSARLSINGIDRSDFIRSASSTNVKVKGKARAIGLSAGDNLIKITNSDGTVSNTFVLRI